MIIVYSILGFALFDYIGFNLMKKYEKTYRVIQVIILISISLFLWKQYNFISGISFLILWWLFVADWIYYLIDTLCNIFGFGFEKWGIMQVFRNQVTWGTWTLFGLFRTYILSIPKSIPMTWITLLIQAIIGIVITITLNK